MRLLRHLLIPTALLAGTGAIAGAQICPGEDMYRFDNEVSFHGFVDKHFDLAIQTGFTQYDSFYLTVEPRSDVTLRFETTVGLDLTIMLRRNGSQFAFGDTEATGLFEANCVNDSDEPSLVYVDITYFDGTGDPDCADYSMQVVHVPDCGTDDIRENDDSCFSSTQLVGLDPGVEHWQISQPGDDDWFGAWLAPGQSLDFSTFCADTVADLDLRLYRAGGTGCGTLLAESATSASNESLSYVNTSSVAEFVAAEVRWAGSAQGAGCAFYSFNYELGTVCGAADIMEPNNDLCSAASLTEGVIDGASVHPSDPDFYVFQPAFEYTAIFAVEYDESLGELDLEVYNVVTGQPCESYQLITFGGIDEPGYDELAVFSGGGFFRFVFEVRNVDPSSGCIPYRLTVASSPPQTLGDTVCFTGPGSSGFPSEIYAFGSDEVSANSLSLSVAGTTPQSNGFFLTSKAYGVVVQPGGAQNNLCIAGNAIGRYVGPGQIQTSDSSGNAFLGLDLTQTPQPTGLVSVQPGESWFFQYWHRDTLGGQPTSRFTSAARVRFR